MSRGGVVDYANAGYEDPTLVEAEMHESENLASTESVVGAKTQDGGTPPGAWHCYKPENSNGFWYLNNGEIVVYGKDTSEANARRIVTAVNAHEELVDVVNLLVMGRELMDASMLLDENSPLIDAARTILAKLKS